MNPVEHAILRTLIYGSLFRFPMSASEIHHFLISEQPIKRADIDATLAHSLVLRDHICHVAGFYALREHQADIALRCQRATITQTLWPLAIRYGAWLGYLPFVRMVALTGALSVHNPHDDRDDFDYMLIAQPGRVWLARAFAVLMVRLMRLRGHEICPNYVLAADQLTQMRHDLYIAHEVTQMTPIYDENLYQRLMRGNRWTQDYLPNAQGIFHVAAPPRFAGWRMRFKRALETWLGGRLGDWLENWEYRRKQTRFTAAPLPEDHDAWLSPEAVKGHFQDHGAPIIRHYAQRLRAYGLDERPSAAAGD